MVTRLPILAINTLEDNIQILNSRWGITIKLHFWQMHMSAFRSFLGRIEETINGYQNLTNPQN